MEEIVTSAAIDTASLSKTDLAEQKLKQIIRLRTLFSCFNELKAVCYWKKGIVRKVFGALRRWAIANAVLRSSASPMTTLPNVVTSHTLSSIAKVQPQDSRSTNPHGSTGGGSIKVRTTRTASKHYVRKKYYSPRRLPEDARLRSATQPSQWERSSQVRSTLGTPAAAVPIRALASHRLYRQIAATAEAAGLSMPATAGLPLVKTSLHLPLADALMPTAQISPTHSISAIMRPPAAAAAYTASTATVDDSSVRQLFSQHHHARWETAAAGPLESEDWSPARVQSPARSCSLAAAAAAPGSPSAAELAFARSRGSPCEGHDAFPRSTVSADQEQWGVDGSCGGHRFVGDKISELGRGLRAADGGTDVDNGNRSQGSRLQAMLRRYQPLEPRAILAHESTDAGFGATPRTILFPPAAESPATPSGDGPRSPPLPVLASAMRRFYRSVLRLQERRTAELEADLRAADHRCWVAYKSAFGRLRSAARAGALSTVQGLLGVAHEHWTQSALMWSFWRSRQRIACSARQQYLAARSRRYCRLLALSRAMATWQFLVEWRRAYTRHVCVPSERPDMQQNLVAGKDPLCAGLHSGDSRTVSSGSSGSSGCAGSALGCNEVEEGELEGKWGLHLTTAELTSASLRGRSPGQAEEDLEPGMAGSSTGSGWHRVHDACDVQETSSECGDGPHRYFLNDRALPPGKDPGAYQVPMVVPALAPFDGAPLPAPPPLWGHESPEPEPRPKLRHAAAAPPPLCSGLEPGMEEVRGASGSLAELTDDEGSDLSLSLYLSSDSEASAEMERTAEMTREIAGVISVRDAAMVAALSPIGSAPRRWSPPSALTSPLEIGASDVLREAVAYRRRTLLLQGLYALSQWALRAQSVATMGEVLQQYRDTRRLRMALGCLRINALL